MKTIKTIIFFSLLNIVNADDKISQPDAVKKALEFVEGSILEQEYNNSKNIYEIQILDKNGTEWCVDINASNGILQELKKH